MMLCSYDLRLSTLGKIFSRWHFLNIFFPKTRFDVLCKVQLETVCLKCCISFLRGWWGEGRKGNKNTLLPLVTTTALVTKDVAVKMNLLL